jgi:hypothetical protein
MAYDVPFRERSRPKEDLVEAMNRTTPLERRTKIRYPVTLTVRYRTLGRYHPISGLGRTVNMSSGGILVASEQGMALGTRLEINLEWPSLLDGLIPLQLVAVGKVVRCVESGFALSFMQYQFRTMSRKFQSTNEDGWDGGEPILVRSAGA